jgi:glycosyltransferase involved in cell wall biosynthesis
LARGLPGGIDVMHYPVTVPIPRTRLPHVVTLMDVQHHDLPHYFSRAERELRRLTYDRAARRADAVVTLSEYSRGRIVEVLGIPPERVEPIHLGIDHERFSPERRGDDERLLASLRVERAFVLYPANLWPHKNHVRLVEAFGRLRDADVELLLTGRTYGRLDPLLAKASAAGARVRHLGYLDAAAIPALYRAARAVVFPSLYEGFGGPPLEAMACGCPVASSTRAALGEVVGDAAVPLDPESVESIVDTLGRVLADGELRSSLRAAGLERARAFSWRVSAERHQAIYERVRATFGVAAR